jgi:hypothetical protein
MIVSALMAVALFAPPETTQSGAAAPAPEAKAIAEAKPAADAKPARHCYTATPSGSRLPRKVCVTKAPEKAEAESQKAE